MTVTKLSETSRLDTTPEIFDEVQRELKNLKEEIEENWHKENTKEVDARNYLDSLIGKSWADIKKEWPVWIRSVQVAMNAMGYSVPENGILAEETKIQVKSFQRKYNLTEDGAPGSVTIKKIIEVWNPTSKNVVSTVESSSIISETVEIQNQTPEHYIDIINGEFRFKNLKTDKWWKYMLINGEKYYEKKLIDNVKKWYVITPNLAPIGWKWMLYIGNFESDLRAPGKWIYIRSDGTKFEGNFKKFNENSDGVNYDVMLDGRWTCTTPEWRLYAGTFTKGAFESDEYKITQKTSSKNIASRSTDTGISTINVPASAEQILEKKEKKPSTIRSLSEVHKLSEKPNMTALDKQNIQKSLTILKNTGLYTLENVQKLDQVEYGKNYLDIGGIKFSRERMKASVEPDKKNKYEVLENADKSVFKRNNQYYMTGKGYARECANQWKTPLRQSDVMTALEALPIKDSKYGYQYYEGGSILGTLLNLSSGMVYGDGKYVDGFWWMITATIEQVKISGAILPEESYVDKEGNEVKNIKGGYSSDFFDENGDVRMSDATKTYHYEFYKNRGGWSFDSRKDNRFKALQPLYVVG